ncbi:MAG: transcription termination factor Rho, partial [Tumebacillaceae bacterium]
EEFKGTGNMELQLDRRLAEKRVFPAIDIRKSGTRREELLLTPEALDKMWGMRKSMSEGTDFVEGFLRNLKKSKTNEDFLATIEGLKEGKQLNKEGKEQHV